MDTKGGNHTHLVDPREVQARLDTPRIIILLNRGYDLNDIKEAIEKRLRDTG